MKSFFLLFVLLLACPPSVLADSGVDRVVVNKSQLRLSLMSGEHVVRSYPIYLGGSPQGHKIYQGDRRTPEGRYLLHQRNAQSRYFLSLRLSYPNEADRTHAQSLGKHPGGDIMIHGMPDLEKRSLMLFKGRNWTDGCIALSNTYMREIWDLVKVNTPIEILP